MLDHKYIQGRADFLRVLDDTLAETRRIAGTRVDYPPIESILVQLDALKRWTDHGREPTPDERRTLAFGQIAARELEPPQTDELQKYCEKLHELSSYVRLWLPDDELTALDPDDWRIYSPSRKRGHLAAIGAVRCRAHAIDASILDGGGPGRTMSREWGRPTGVMARPACMCVA